MLWFNVSTDCNGDLSIMVHAKGSSGEEVRQVSNLLEEISEILGASGEGKYRLGPIKNKLDQQDALVLEALCYQLCHCCVRDVGRVKPTSFTACAFVITCGE